MKLSKLDFKLTLKKLYQNIKKVNSFAHGFLAAFEGDSYELILAAELGHQRSEETKEFLR